MRRKKVILTFAASLLFRAFSAGTATAQVAINCTQPLRFGGLISCGAGRFRIRPDSSLPPVEVTGCGNAAAPPAIQPAPAQCIISTTAGAPSKSIKVEIPTATVTIFNAPNTFQMERWRMSTSGNPNTSLTQIILTPAQVVSGVTVNIGAQVIISDGQAVGTYTGSNVIRASLVP